MSVLGPKTDINTKVWVFFCRHVVKVYPLKTKMFFFWNGTFLGNVLVFRAVSWFFRAYPACCLEVPFTILVEMIFVSRSFDLVEMFHTFFGLNDWVKGR